MLPRIFFTRTKSSSSVLSPPSLLSSSSSLSLSLSLSTPHSSAMERTMKVTLISAEDLKRAKLLSKMEVYAVAWLSCDPSDQRRTAADEHNRRNPNWSDAPFQFKIPRGVDLGSLLLHVELRTERSLGGCRVVGEVCVRVRDLDDGGATAGRLVSYQVSRPNGRPRGVLHFSYAFSGGIAAVSPPLSAFSAGYPDVHYSPLQPLIHPQTQPYVACEYGYGAQQKPGIQVGPPPSHRFPYGQASVQQYPHQHVVQ